MRNYLLFACCLLTHTVLAQVAVTGVVTDEQNEPLIGVSVMVKGTLTGVATDMKGQFSIQADSGDVLEIAFIGFEKQTVVLQGQDRLIVKLVESQSGLEEVVVIGYQTVTRKKTTAAISSISGKELENIPAASFDMLLQGRLAGVNVQNFAGAPGSAPSVSVRGTSAISTDYSGSDYYNVLSQPLYVVDGIPQPTEQYVSPNTGTGTNYLAGLNPNDIESIDVLRDASAASIYGSRAANGVILITTKKGSSGEPKVTFNAYTGVTMRPELRSVTLGTIERGQKMEVLERQLTYDQQRYLPIMLTDSLNPAFSGNTNWQDLFYRTGMVKNADLSVSGGGAGGMNYRFSSNYYDEDGIIKGTGFKRYTIRLNLFSRAIKEKFTINPIISYAHTDRARGNGEGNSPIAVGAGAMPSSLFNLSESKEAYLLGAYEENLDQNVGNRFIFNLNLGYLFNPNFRFTSQTSYTYKTERRDYNRTNELTSGSGNYSYTFSDNQDDILSSNYFSYNNTFSRHNLSVIAGQDVQFNRYQNTQALGSTGVSDQIQVVQGFLQNNIGAYSDYQAWGLLSYYTRLGYDFDSKYIVSASVRADGSSRFGKNNKWGFFPSASAAWLLSEENFLKDHTSISLLKLRASLGTSGSLPDENYLQYNLYRVNAGGFAGNGGAASYNGQAAIVPNFYSGVAQKGLTWEKSTQWNIGTDIELFNGKYSLMFDVFNKESSMQLFAVELPVTTGYDIAYTNSVGIRNAGFDLALTAAPLPRGRFRWTSNLNVSYVRNAIMNLPNGGRDLVLSGDRFDKSHILSVGKPVNAFYLYQTLGVFSAEDKVPVNPYTGERFRNSNGTYAAGDFWFADLDGDYFIDTFNSGINPDKIPVGDPNPKWTGGWTNTLTYQNLTLTVFCTFTFDRDVLNLYESDLFSNATAGGAANNFAYFSIPDLNEIDIWRQAGDQAEYAKMDLGSYRYYYTSAQTFFLEKGGYFRVKNIIGSYDFKPEVLSRLGLNRLRVYGMVDNAFVFQQSGKLPDAEAVNPYGEYNGAGYPIPRKYTFGLEVTF